MTIPFQPNRIEDFFVEQVFQRGEIVSLFQFASEAGVEYRHLRLCAKRAVRKGLLVEITLDHLPGRPKCYRPASGGRE